MKFSGIVLALCAVGASAFMPQSTPRFMATKLYSSNQYGKYDDQLWDINAKKDVFAAWDPEKPRSEVNFNPFERDDTGNAADASGYFPGENRYKDPIRPDASFAIMQEEAKIMAELSEDPKFQTTGKPGNLK
mmetsp:Transcript_33231/g.56864  ORF Transcript_33231/g.56864 Transcript_33231/m.56864 type:complete len:132 (+) Transcript_33231:52-447(+)|eukprot:CAMPEP_0205905450 /NCGR_PEP_ID=MMETSP1325-20131115/1353_1 /ASSEMBLY_ACC=CAM_ASM_000708 /TAXON_ID=236786 /ORGANISM="Florenciella sp., Strain RCC1007" /LENGTH=131 /DNA_ID=CAMNT_0053271361 /DNA_START=147 /DNA_END=542 /DNA_ORIENTATION=-